MIRRLILSLFAFSFMIATADAAQMTSQSGAPQMTSQAAAAKPAAAIEARQVVTGRSAWHHHWHHWHRWHHWHHWHH